MTTRQEVLDFWEANETPEAKEQQAEIKALKKDIEIAQKFVRDAAARYRKEKLRSRSKAKAESDTVFADLEEYNSTEDIRNAYGWEIITEREMDRLMDLWELRENAKAKKGIYQDRVTEMLTGAVTYLWEHFGGPVAEYEEKDASVKKAAAKIADENRKHDWERMK